jgi:hypothetical protein
MKPQDRKRLEELRLSPEVIAKTEDVLRVWEIEDLFVVCSFCGKPCINPKLRRKQYRRKKPPAELFEKIELGFEGHDGSIICWSCDNAQFQ